MLRRRARDRVREGRNSTGALIATHMPVDAHRDARVTMAKRLAGGLQIGAGIVILIQDPWLGLGWSVPDTLIVIAFLAVPAALTRRFLR